MHAIPGDPFIGDKILPPEVTKALNAFYGLNLPLWKQYIQFLNHLFHFELGTSISYPGRKVGQFIADGFPISAFLGIQALVISVPLGVFLGTWSAMKRGQFQDLFAMLFSVFLISLPNFVIASLLQYLFSIQFHLLPVARWGTYSHTILPTLALSAMPTAVIARFIRTNMIEALSQDYIRTALAKGIPLFKVAIRHALRNAIIPTISYLGPIISSILTGSFMIEKIFAIPGLGGWMIHSIYMRDYPMILGLTIFYCMFLMLMVFIVDLLYLWIDPRITYE